VISIEEVPVRNPTRSTSRIHQFLSQIISLEKWDILELERRIERVRVDEERKPTSIVVVISTMVVRYVPRYYQPLVLSRLTVLRAYGYGASQEGREVASPRAYCDWINYTHPIPVTRDNTSKRSATFLKRRD
jgi:hypothetical protein